MFANLSIATLRTCVHVYVNNLTVIGEKDSIIPMPSSTHEGIHNVRTCRLYMCVHCTCKLYVHVSYMYMYMYTYLAPAANFVLSRDTSIVLI